MNDQEQTDIRSSLVDRIRCDIDEDRYDTPERLESAQGRIEEVLAESMMS